MQDVLKPRLRIGHCYLPPSLDQKQVTWLRPESKGEEVVMVGGYYKVTLQAMDMSMGAESL